jgi:hypothetical protein
VYTSNKWGTVACATVQGITTNPKTLYIIHVFSQLHLLVSFIGSAKLPSITPPKRIAKAACPIETMSSGIRAEFFPCSLMIAAQAPQRDSVLRTNVVDGELSAGLRK